MSTKSRCCALLSKSICNILYQQHEEGKLLGKIAWIIHQSATRGKAEGEGRAVRGHLSGGEENEIEGLDHGGCKGQIALVLEDARHHAQHRAPAQPLHQLAHDQAAPPLQQPRAARAPKPAVQDQNHETHTS